MKASLLPDQITPLTAAQVCRAFDAAFKTVTGRTATHRTLAILMAQSALESGRWKSLHQFNFTNIKAAETYEGFYCLYRCNEIINGKVEWFDPPHPQCRFRAYIDAEDGAEDYLRFLAERKRYREAWEQAIAGDPVSFVAALKRGGFFTADETPYRKAVISLTNEYAPQIAGWLAETPDEPDEVTNVRDDEIRELSVRALGQQFDPLDLDDNGFPDREAPTKSDRPPRQA